MRTTEHAVVIAGGGPTGLMLAGELALAGVDVTIVERRASQDLAGSRAGGLHSRTIEILDQRGIADRFLSQGQVAQVAGFAWIPLDISDFPTRHPYGLALWQNHIERILADWVAELAVPIHRGREVTGFAQDAAALHLAARRAAGAAQPRRARRPGHHSLGRPRPVDRRSVRRHLGASGCRGGPRTCRRAGPARRIRGLGGSRVRGRARRRAHHLVRTAGGGVAHPAATDRRKRGCRSSEGARARAPVMARRLACCVQSRPREARQQSNTDQQIPFRNR
jgi:hypothetical protein